MMNRNGNKPKKLRQNIPKRKKKKKNDKKVVGGEMASRQQVNVEGVRKTFGQIFCSWQVVS